MWLLALSLASAAPIDDFGVALKAAVDAKDEAFLRAFLADMLAGVPPERVEEELRTGTDLLTGWFAKPTSWRCIEPYCELAAGGRRVMSVKAAPAGHPTAFVMHSQGAQRDRFYDHYTISVQAEGAVRVLINGQPTLAIGEVKDTKVKTSYLNDWLVLGENRVTIEPITKDAKVSLRVGAHPTWHPSPDKSRGNAVSFDGPLKDTQTWTFHAAPPKTEPLPWPTVPETHLQAGLQRWFDGGDERVLEPWRAWLDDDVRDGLRRAGVKTLTPVMFQIDVTVAEKWHLNGYFVLSSEAPRWVLATFEERAGRGEYPPIDGPWRVWSDPVEGLVASLRDAECTGAKERVPVQTIAEKLPTPRYSEVLAQMDAPTGEALRAACAAFATLPADVSLTYLYDEIVYAGVDAEGRTVAIANGELSYRTASPFLVSMLKPPRRL